ncbi:hypothetical protein [Mesorhizobium ciceri]|nr:hypothetical protein [Mesorhizobium ciceri]
MPEIVLPKSRYWIGFNKGGGPTPSGGWIDRKDDKECAAFEPSA